MAANTIPRLTVSLTRPLSISSRRVSAESRDVAAMSRPKARWDMKRRDTSSASVCMMFGITTFMYMLPSNERIDDSVGAKKKGEKRVQMLVLILHRRNEGKSTRRLLQTAAGASNETLIS